ncbi:GNAT family N-acetyltransferase [Shewanella sp. SNU WT4]|uniref:GNAT family N-acetyltransferase n=1 Tax=Shewanella sp. SNU WT4 TaxID=2590015 RepID=UPI001F0E0E16|nr:GNAT family N-acetyltransferase [Shewanella sp. SNU WT4]
MMTITIRRAVCQDIKAIAPLFDAYRQFYECPPDLALAEDFIGKRLTSGESVIFVASQGDILLGFTQLYWSFCSVEAIKIVILYDLFVADSGRQQGIARQLMQTACDYSFTAGAGRVDLLTGKTNVIGQALYESLGFYRSLDDFYGYSCHKS